MTNNDDKDFMFGTNNYSFIRFELKKGEKYFIKVTPFMDEELSSVEHMNIISRYILQIDYSVIKEVEK